MPEALARLKTDVTHADVVRAIKEYDRLGPEQFFSEHGYGPSRSYRHLTNRPLGVKKTRRTHHRTGPRVP
jgi:hypothetical protein